eukprot:9840316-Ditylum_brightwellii.AAC.1
MMRTTDQARKMREANSEIGVGVLFTQQSTKKARKGAVLDAAIGDGRDAKDCGDFFMVEKGWFVGNQQEYVKRFI